MNMEWIELLIAGFIGLVVSGTLITFILQAGLQQGLAGRVRVTPGAKPASGSGWRGHGWVRILIALLVVFAFLLGSGSLLNSEKWVVITAGLAIFGGLAGMTLSNAFVTVILQSSGLGETARDPHHTHQVPVSRLGGIALAGALVAVSLVFSVIHGSEFLLSSDKWLVIAASLAMFGLGLWDDFHALGAQRKLLGQLAIASATWACGIGISHFQIPLTNHIIELGFWSWPLTVFWLVAMTNLINLIDGVDGLAGGICLMLMVLLLYVTHQNDSLPVIAAGMIGALVAFLRFNFPPARIYMGDGGAYFLGFLMGCITIVTAQKGTILAGLVAPLFVLALPIIDTSLAILRRGLSGLPLFRPDRRHIHHRLLALGHSRRKVVLGFYGVTAIFLGLAFATYCLHGQFFALILGAACLIVLVLAGKFSFSREWFAIGRVLGNSIVARSDVQYGISLSRWLALEGTRAQTLDELAEDVVFTARKLGFSRVRIGLAEGEKVWRLNPVTTANVETLRHGLPGHNDCFLELQVCHPDSTVAPTAGGHTISNSAYPVLADLVAEGWAKAVSDWSKINQSPVRFGFRPETAPGETTAAPQPGIKVSFP